MYLCYESTKTIQFGCQFFSFSLFLRKTINKDWERCLSDFFIDEGINLYHTLLFLSKWASKHSLEEKYMDRNDMPGLKKFLL